MLILLGLSLSDFCGVFGLRGDTIGLDTEVEHIKLNMEVCFFPGILVHPFTPVFFSLFGLIRQLAPSTGLLLVESNGAREIGACHVWY
jgi:hypothetical protein